MSDATTTIVLSLLGSGAFSALIAGIFNLIITRKGKLAKIEEDIQALTNKQDESFQAVTKRQQVSEKDALRTQLLMMIKDYPHEKTDILRLAEYYFKELEGNWVASNVFMEWCEENDIPLPPWFNEHKKK